MASMEIYEPICAEQDCGQRATRRIVGADGTATGVFCTKHAGPALKALTEQERTQKTKPTAVRS